MRTLVIDIGGTKFTLAAFENSTMLARECRLTDRRRGPDGILPAVEEIVRNWRAKIGFVPDRCGIGFGGPVDFSSQTVTLSTHVGGWECFPLIEAVRRIAGGAPTIMDNDANVGALGEAVYGAGQGYDPLFYMTLSTGIGGGLVAGGQVYRGADSFAGEIGHLNVDPNGPECLCGSNGCLERMCCGLWMERDCAQSARELMLDPDFVRRYVVYLARGLKAAIMLLNPGRIVIGGGIAKAGPRLFDPLREEVNRQLTSWSRARRDLVPAELGDDSVLYGALVLADEIR